MAASNPDTSPAVGGAIAHYHLTDWWLSTFTPAERARIEKLSDPRKEGFLTKSYQVTTYGTATMLLNSLVGQLRAARDRDLVRRILEKAEQVARKGNHLSDLHATYDLLIRLYEKLGKRDPLAQEKLIYACKLQIIIAHKIARLHKDTYPDIPLPKHAGFYHLADALEKKNRFEEAHKVAREAQLEGWAGDWSLRIERLKHKHLLAARGEEIPPPGEGIVTVETHFTWPCPQCAKSMRIPRAFAGLSGYCRFCGAIVTTPREV